MSKTETARYFSTRIKKEGQMRFTALDFLDTYLRERRSILLDIIEIVPIEKFGKGDLRALAKAPPKIL